MKTLAALIIGGSLALGSAAVAEPKLYAGETATTAAGFPAVAYFRKGDADKPLVVFAGRPPYGADKLWRSFRRQA